MSGHPRCDGAARVLDARILPVSHLEPTGRLPGNHRPYLPPCCFAVAREPLEYDSLPAAFSLQVTAPFQKSDDSGLTMFANLVQYVLAEMWQQMNAMPHIAEGGREGISFAAVTWWKKLSCRSTTNTKIVHKMFNMHKFDSCPPGLKMAE